MIKVLFRIPFTLYFLAYIKKYRLLVLTTKCFDSEKGDYTFKSVGDFKDIL